MIYGNKFLDTVNYSEILERAMTEAYENDFGIDFTLTEETTALVPVEKKKNMITKVFEGITKIVSTLFEKLQTTLSKMKAKIKGFMRYLKFPGVDTIREFFNVHHEGVKLKMVRVGKMSKILSTMINDGDISGYADKILEDSKGDLDKIKAIQEKMFPGAVIKNAIPPFDKEGDIKLFQEQCREFISKDNLIKLGILDSESGKISLNTYEDFMKYYKEAEQEFKDFDTHFDRSFNKVLKKKKNLLSSITYEKKKMTDNVKEYNSNKPKTNEEYDKSYLDYNYMMVCKNFYKDLAVGFVAIINCYSYTEVQYSEMVQKLNITYKVMSKSAVITGGVI